MAGDIAKRATDVEQDARMVAGKTFTQNGATWNDTAIQSAQNPVRKRVQFASGDYFALLDKSPEVSQWLVLGNNVTFAPGGEIYEVYE